jgi:hypothetical protein
MAQLHRSVVALRITGDELNPEEITQLLKCSPTKSRKKGDIISTNPQTGRENIAKFGMWSLSASDREPEDLNTQIQEILCQITDDFGVWQKITGKYRADLFCGLFMRHENEGLTISSDSLVALGSRGIEIGFDIYAADLE